MAWRLLLLLLALAAVVGGGSSRAVAADYDDPAAYCAAVGTIDRPDASYRGPAVPDWMARALRRVSGGAEDAPLDPFRRARWRCAKGKVLACLYGANIPCDEKADTQRRANQGSIAFCHDNPQAETVPAVATGHATIYAWRCQDGQPVIARKVLKIDKQGYAKAFWHMVGPDAAAAPGR